MNVISILLIRTELARALLLYPFSHIERSDDLLHNVQLVRFIHLNTGQEIRVTYNVSGSSLNVDLLTPRLGNAGQMTRHVIAVMEGLRLNTFIETYKDDDALIDRVVEFITALGQEVE